MRRLRVSRPCALAICAPASSHAENLIELDGMDNLLKVPRKRAPLAIDHLYRLSLRAIPKRTCPDNTHRAWSRLKK
jgi:hypothetical protein